MNQKTFQLWTLFVVALVIAAMGFAMGMGVSSTIAAPLTIVFGVIYIARRGRRTKA